LDYKTTLSSLKQIHEKYNITMTNTNKDQYIESIKHLGAKKTIADTEQHLHTLSLLDNITNSVNRMCDQVNSLLK